MGHLYRLVVLGVACASVTALSAGAAPSLVSPAAGTTMTASHPTFSWTLPAGEVGESISVGRTSRLTATGDFATRDFADAAILEPGQSTWTTAQALEAGTYWWHVASRSETAKHLFSPLRLFTIRPALTIESIAVKAFKAQRTFLITVMWRANTRKVAYAGELRQGAKRIAERRLATDNFMLDSKKLDVSTWIVPPSVKKGAPLRFSVGLTPQGGRTVTAAKTLRVP